MSYSMYTLRRRGFFTQKYEIYQNDELKYWARAKSLFSYGTIYFYDEYDQEVLVIEKRSIMSYNFNIHREDELIAEVNQKIFSKNCAVELGHTCYQVKRNMLSSEYTFLKGEEEFAKVSRKKMNFNFKSGVAVSDDYDQELVLAIVICLFEAVRMKQSG